MRYIVFQSLEHTLGVSPDIWRVLDKAHGARNAADYGGNFQVNERLLKDILAATTVVRQRVLDSSRLVAATAGRLIRRPRVRVGSLASRRRSWRARPSAGCAARPWGILEARNVRSRRKTHAVL